MCKKCPPPAVTCDYSEQATKETLTTLLRGETGLSVSPRWIDEIWKVNSHHAERLGPTLRREVCVPDLTGENLLEAYIDAICDETQPLTTGLNYSGGSHAVEICYAWFGDHNYPRWLTVEHCETQKGARGRKLSRCLADWLGTTYQANPYLTADCVSQAIDRIQTRVKAQNGRKLVLSGNPLDKILASNFATYASGSCHRWFNNLGEGDRPGTQYYAGHMAYAFTPETLVLTSHTSEVATFGGVTLPRKTWRQLVHVIDIDGQPAAFLMRHYGNAPCELVHNTARKMVAEYLAGTENPSWRKLRGSCSTESEYAYTGDGTESAIVLSSGEPASDEPRSQRIAGHLTLSDPRCPCCGRSRSDGNATIIGCSGCFSQGIACCVCGDYVDEEDLQSHNDDNYCTSCFNDRFTYCNRCEEYHNDDDFTDVDGDSVCSSCADNAYTCEGCSDLFWETSCDNLCDSCQQDANDEAEAAAEEEAEQAEAEAKAEAEAEQARIAAAVNVSSIARSIIELWDGTGHRPDVANVAELNARISAQCSPQSR